MFDFEDIDIKSNSESQETFYKVDSAMYEKHAVAELIRKHLKDKSFPLDIEVHFSVSKMNNLVTYENLVDEVFKDDNIDLYNGEVSIHTDYVIEFKPYLQDLFSEYSFLYIFNEFIRKFNIVSIPNGKIILSSDVKHIVDNTKITKRYNFSSILREFGHIKIVGANLFSSASDYKKQAKVSFNLKIPNLLKSLEVCPVCETLKVMPAFRSKKGGHIINMLCKNVLKLHMSPLLSCKSLDALNVIKHNCLPQHNLTSFKSSIEPF